MLSALYYIENCSLLYVDKRGCNKMYFFTFSLQPLLYVREKEEGWGWLVSMRAFYLWHSEVGVLLFLSNSNKI